MPCTQKGVSLEPRSGIWWPKPFWNEEGLAKNCCETASCKLGCPCLDIHSLATNRRIYGFMGLLERIFLPCFKVVSVVRFHSLVREIHPSAYMVSETVLFHKSAYIRTQLAHGRKFLYGKPDRISYYTNSEYIKMMFANFSAICRWEVSLGNKILSEFRC